MTALVHPHPRPSAAIARDEAVERRLTECRGEFLRFFRRRLARAEDAEDALQDFSIKAIRSAGTLLDDERIDAWLARVLRNTLTDHYRRRAARQRAEAAYAVEPRETAVGPEAVGPEAEPTPSRCLHDLLPALRPDYAQIIRSADLDEAPRERIAAELGLTANNVGVRLHRARRALKSRLEERCAGCPEGGFRSCGCVRER